MKNVKIICIIAVFLAGLYFYMYPRKEGFATGSPRCPNLLIQKGTKYYLYNSDLAQVPGVNPIEFNNLEEYTEFLEWQRNAGIRCPVLYVQNAYDAQGNRVYKVRPSVSELEGGLPPSTTPNNTPLPVPLPMKFPENVNPDQNYYIGSLTSPADMVKNSDYNMLYSDNPMDPNWGGTKYTQALVDSGYYKGNEVSINVP